MQATKAPSKTIPVSELLPGDILLSCGTEPLSHLITRLDGGDYSHAAVFDGKQAVDATKKGFVRNDLDKDMKGQWYMDAYRWHSPPPGSTPLGNEPFPSAPVIARSDRIVDPKTEFAYDELFMVALVVSLSKTPPDKWLRMAVRMLLSRVEQWIHEHVTTRAGARAMTCSESVAVSFDEAEPPPKYNIEIEADENRDLQAFAPAPAAESSYDALRRRYAELVAEAAPNTAAALRVVALAPSGLDGSRLPPGALTPHDIQRSGSLTRLGRLSENETPPSANWPTWRLFLALILEYLFHHEKTLSRR